MGRFYLDKEKDIVVDTFLTGDDMRYVLHTPYHHSGNLITNLAKLCGLQLSFDENGLKVIEGTIPCYINGENRKVWIFRLGNVKVANIHEDMTVDMKAMMPSISKTLMSQTKDYRLDLSRTITKKYILAKCKFTTDLHTHMNANLKGDVLMAMGIVHQIRYPYYYIKKLGLSLSQGQRVMLEAQRKKVTLAMSNGALSGKHLDRKIDDNTFINFADLILGNLEQAEFNIPRIRASLAVMKDGQAVFTNLEKVYLYRYVFTKGAKSEYSYPLDDVGLIPDRDIVAYCQKMILDDQDDRYKRFSLFQDKLLWIARGYQSQGVKYVEISDTTLVKPKESVQMLKQVHEAMDAIYEETHVRIRFLAAMRRIPLTIMRDMVRVGDYLGENLQVLQAVSIDPYVAGSDFVGEEINDIRELENVIREVVRIAESDESFVIRIHAGENDSLKDNVLHSIECVRRGLRQGQKMPMVRIGHGLYTPNLSSKKGQRMMAMIQEDGVVLEFQISSNVRLNNLSDVRVHPLKQYLSAGVKCVQGTDGGALYGTDSMDEQISLMNMLGLSEGDMMAMCRNEQEIIAKSEEAFKRKKEAFECLAAQVGIEAFLESRIASAQRPINLYRVERQEAAVAFAAMIEELPMEKKPVVIAGGSFNNDAHKTRMSAEGKKIIDGLLEQGDPEKIFFVIGHSMSGYEKYLCERNKRFEVFAFAPCEVSQAQRDAIVGKNVKVRVSIESSPMGLYKSFAYEIFKRRASVLVGLDGNSAMANLIQEANNGRADCRIFLNERVRSLKKKAMTLEGYVTCFSDASIIGEILEYCGKE